MKDFLLKILLGLVFLSVLFFGGLYLFRGDFPLLWIPYVILCIVGFIYFPYNKIFKIK